MKKLSKLGYLLIALVIMASCEQETMEPELSKKSTEIEALIQQYAFLSEAVESGFDVESYIASLNVTPEEDVIERTPDVKNSHSGRYIMVGNCWVYIGSYNYNIRNMNDDIMYLMYDVCEEANEERMPWERPYDAEGAFRNGMVRIVIRGARRDYITWDQASDIMECAEDFDLNDCYNDY